MDFRNLPKPFFVLAPMDEVTETVFRQIVESCAPADLYFTEFVNVDGLQSPGRHKLLKKLRFTQGEGPLVAQLWGLNPDNFEAIARQVSDGTIAKELGLPDGVNFVGIDINMGCPAKSEVQNGACSALIKNRPLAKEIIEATIKGAGDMPVSVKTRLGFNEIDLSWHEFLLGFKIHMLTVHGRTRKEMSKVPAHWDLIGEMAKLRDRISPNTLIVGNGDVLSHQQGVELATKYGWDGVMIGRGIFHNPFVFSEVGSDTWVNYDIANRIELLRRHVELFRDTWGDERKFETLKKFAKVYISDFDGAKEMREKFMSTNSYDELLELLKDSK
jgi:tRNA-dihydrouridine synthase